MILTFPLRLKVTNLIRNIRDHSLNLVMTLLRTRHKPTARGTTQLLRYLRILWLLFSCIYTTLHLLTLGHRVELGPQLSPDRAHLPGPLAAVLLCHVATLQWKNHKKFS